MSQRITRELRQFYRKHRGQCSECSRPLQQDELEHLGYAADGSMMYVGDCCSQKLQETAVRYGYSPVSFDVPSGEAVIWRYMDFPKLLHLVASRKLYFRRADLLPDRWEGAVGTMARKPQWDAFYRNFFARIVREPPPGFPALSEEEATRQAEELFRGYADRKTRDCHTFVNCWHENERESEAMWRLYSAYLQNAVAIRTTVGRLTEALGDDPDVDIGRVKYTDYDKHFVGKHVFFHKRLSFSHEREIRAIVSSLNLKDSTGWLRPVNIDVLIESIHLSPEAPEWFVFVIEDALAKHDVRALVQRSSLLAQPFY